MPVMEWEYMRTDSFESLAALGREGWELVNAVSKGQGREYFYLKRQAPSIQQEITRRQREAALREEAK